MATLKAQNPETITSNSNVMIIAHRGGAQLAPENTMAAFHKALLLKADMIELDVRLTADNEVVVMHDLTLNRTTDLKGSVSNKNLSEIQEADAGSWFSRDYKGERIPMLEQVLVLISGKCKLLIELKASANDGRLEKEIAGLINKYNAYHWCIVQSFDIKSLQLMDKLDNRIELHYLCLKPGNKLLHPHLYQFIRGINIHHRFASKKVIQNVKKSGKTIFVWTASKSETLKKLIKKKPDGIITDNPYLMRQLLGN